MPNWIPKNKATGIEYPPIDDATRAKYEQSAYTRGKYTFKAVPEPKQPTPSAPAPVEAKKPDTEKK